MQQLLENVPKSKGNMLQLKNGGSGQRDYSLQTIRGGYRCLQVYRDWTSAQEDHDSRGLILGVVPQQVGFGKPLYKCPGAELNHCPQLFYDPATASHPTPLIWALQNNTVGQSSEIYYLSYNCPKKKAVMLWEDATKFWTKLLIIWQQTFQGLSFENLRIIFKVYCPMLDIVFPPPQALLWAILCNSMQASSKCSISAKSTTKTIPSVWRM